VDEWASAGTVERTGKRSMVWVCAVAGWLAATGIAFGAMSAYASRPGSSAVAPTAWPTESRLARTNGRATLVMIAHTKCPCTRASFRELERLMARAGTRAEAFVVFVGPRESTSSGLLDLRDSARAIPGVRVVEDEREAHLFGALTSGQVVLFDARSAQVFRGGITVARGHEGASAGGDIVRRFLTAAPAASATTQATEVFGCRLFQRDEASGAQASGGGKEP
jgi:hypothetical protein